MIYIDNTKMTASFTIRKSGAVWDLINILVSNGYWVKVNELEDKYEITIKEDN